ncbi:MAG: aminomethyl-transferring glycine dehydrogenase subunit GcvPB [Clostridiales bacterium]|nr:aminomethyl-transferring glycine dehydrogenase subunit GcvPB [Clostridiales bacterium]
MKLIFEITKEDRRSVRLPMSTIPSFNIPKEYARGQRPHLPEVSKIDLVRHYTALSLRTHGVDNGFYPLGSCTMKYNPKVNEKTASLVGFTNIHPLQSAQETQGALELMYDLKTMLCEITGMYDMTMQPAAGAHGEWTGLMMMKKYHEMRGDTQKRVILVPDSAHGTNPASAHVAGFDVKSIPSAADGGVDLEALRDAVGDDTAGLMLTNPNTLGIFESRIVEMAKIVHEAGGLLYYDGANLNAIMGQVRPGDMGFDVIHLNLHKTFSTPHGGGGPGSGPVGCAKRLAQFLPTPNVEKKGDTYFLQHDNEDSIGSVKSFYGHFLTLVRAYTYILSLGADGLSDASRIAVLNANYMMARLKDTYTVPFNGLCMHEFVMTAQKLKEETGISAMDVAKALLDEGIHPPTVYFPLIVKEAMMVEPTETESIETLDHACDVLLSIARIAKEDPQQLHDAPVTTVISRLDEVEAARNPILRYSISL